MLFRYLSLALRASGHVFQRGGFLARGLASIRQRRLTMEVPIAAGLAALYAQSVFEVVGHRGPAMLIRLPGWFFSCLCGRLFQQKTYERLAFDRDYKSFFPLSVMRKTGSGEEIVALSNDLRVGDRIVLRNGELIPADATLVDGAACMDYSFVTGESEPVAKAPGDHLYAGGRQVGGAIEVETVKPVSQSYLTSLWNHEAFRK